MIEFKAKVVEAFSQEYTEDCIVHQIFFEESDPEKGGQSWNFSRELGDDDDGVCTVKEIQQATIYEGISSFNISSNKLVCKFDETGEAAVGANAIIIEYELNDDEWKKLKQIASLVFSEKLYFSIA